MSNTIDFSAIFLYCKNFTSPRNFFKATSLWTWSVDNTSFDSIPHQQKQHKILFSFGCNTEHKWNNPSNTSFCARNIETQQPFCAARPIVIFKSLFNNCHIADCPMNKSIGWIRWSSQMVFCNHRDYLLSKVSKLPQFHRIGRSLDSMSSFTELLGSARGLQTR